jgi:hypothetical protein
MGFFRVETFKRYIEPINKQNEKVTRLVDWKGQYCPLRLKDKYAVSGAYFRRKNIGRNRRSFELMFPR